MYCILLMRKSFRSSMIIMTSLLGQQPHLLWSAQRNLSRTVEEILIWHVIGLPCSTSLLQYNKHNRSAGRDYAATQSEGSPQHANMTRRGSHMPTENPIKPMQQLPADRRLFLALGSPQTGTVCTTYLPRYTCHTHSM